MLLSIIIPVYKVEEYLNKCVDSVLNALSGQEDEYEIILVNDGSPDNCGAMCDEYAKKHKHISVIHKENGGLSDARNFGIDKAIGEYIVLLDSDDWVSEEFKGFVEEIKQNKGVDYFQVGYIKINPSGELLGTRANKITGLFNVSPEILSKAFIDVAWAKIVRRDFLIEHNLYFTKGKLHEDFEWNARLWIHAKTMFLSASNYYMYLIDRPGSIMNDFKLKNFLHIVQSATENWERVNNAELCKKHKRVLKEYISGTIMHLTCTMYKRKITKEDLGIAIQHLKEHKYLFKYPKNFKQRIATLFIKIFGIKMGTKIVSVFY